VLDQWDGGYTRRPLRQGSGRDKDYSMSAKSISTASALESSREVNFNVMSKMSLSNRSSRPVNRENMPCGVTEQRSGNERDSALVSHS
jgi:hypothetical protein